MIRQWFSLLITHSNDLGRRATHSARKCCEHCLSPFKPIVVFVLICIGKSEYEIAVLIAQYVHHSCYQLIESNFLFIFFRSSRYLTSLRSKSAKSLTLLSYAA